jgi:flagellar biosynthetic protein FliQ
VTEAQVIEFARDTITTMITIAAPVLLVGLVIGIAISLLQTLTSIQEITLTFVPKILVIFVSLLVLLPFMFNKLAELTQRMYALIATGT